MLPQKILKISMHTSAMKIVGNYVKGEKVGLGGVGRGVVQEPKFLGENMKPY